MENPELIFGIQHKMTSVDPYFYYSSKFREACLNDARLIVIIGYSFADDYVNVILSQALKSRSYIRILCVEPGHNIEEKKKNIALKLNTNEAQIIVEDATAKKFITEIMNIDYLANYLEEPEDVPFLIENDASNETVTEVSNEENFFEKELSEGPFIEKSDQLGD